MNSAVIVAQILHTDLLLSLVVFNDHVQALQNKPITIYGDGSQTRSFQYVADLVDGLVMLMESDYRKSQLCHHCATTP
jgi:nucleoside-diphosphate-sugar epimerase